MLFRSAFPSKTVPSSNKSMERLLILEDGTVFEGKAFGADASVLDRKSVV